MATEQLRSLVRLACQKLGNLRERREFGRLSNDAIFSRVYSEGLWGRGGAGEEPYSGSGSHDDAIVAPYVSAVTEFLKTFPNKPDVADLGCGDFNVGTRLRPFAGRYIACDVVPVLIERNKHRFVDLDVSFGLLDMVRDPLPKVDVICIRQVLQHLSNAHIAAVLAKIPHSCRYFILTEHVPAQKDFPANRDKPTGPETRIGYRSGVVVTRPPFSLAVKGERILCEVPEGHASVIRTIVYTM